jgi:hydrogenase maturation protein HypF
VLHQLRTGLNAPPTTSVGRLFDAVASLVDACQEARYEGEAAIALEGLAGGRDAFAYPLELGDGEPAVIATAPVIAAIVRDLGAGAPPAEVAARLHATVAAMALEAARRVRAQSGLTTVALSGGVFQNVRLLDLTTRCLGEDGFTVLTHRLVPPNDGGLALGQAAITAAAG